MESGPPAWPVHTHRTGPHDASQVGRQPEARNNDRVAGESGQRSGANSPYHSHGERWERGGHRGGRGRGTSRGVRGRFSNVSLRLNGASRKETATLVIHQGEAIEPNEVEGVSDPEEPLLETQEERDKFYQEVCSMFVLCA